MNWNEFAREVHQVAVEKGLWDKPVSFDEIALECHAALTRAWEEHKARRPNLYHLCAPSAGKPCALDCGEAVCTLASGDPCEHQDAKPRGVAVELAGCVLSILDWIGAKEDKELIIECCSHRGGFLKLLNNCHQEVADASFFIEENHSGRWIRSMERCIRMILAWATANGVDMEAVLREVLEYNKRHGKAEGWV